MGFAEIIDYNTMTAKRLSDGEVETLPLKLCDGCAMYRSPFGGIDVDLQPLMRPLWFCTACQVDPKAEVLT